VDDRRVAQELVTVARELTALPDDDERRLDAVERRLKTIARNIRKLKRELETEEGYVYDIMARHEVGSELNQRVSSMWKKIQLSQGDLDKADFDLEVKGR